MNKFEYLISNSKMLKRLYFEDRLTTRQIGKMFGMSKHPVEIAMHHLGFELTHERTKGHKPSKEFLMQAIFQEHRSLLDISNELGCDPGAIRYWAKQYDFEMPKYGSWTQRNLQRGYKRPTKAFLVRLYNRGNSLQIIADKIGVSRQAIYDMFKTYSIPIRRSGWKGCTELSCTDGHIVKSVYEQKVDNWLTENKISHVYEPKLPFNRMKGDFLANGVYIEVFGVMDSDIYEERKKRKIEGYKTKGLDLISINYWDFSSQKKGLWHRKLQRLLE